jgi:hypothetical protein
MTVWMFGFELHDKIILSLVGVTALAKQGVIDHQRGHSSDYGVRVVQTKYLGLLVSRGGPDDSPAQM